jgi:hypothetical protein
MLYIQSKKCKQNRGNIAKVSQLYLGFPAEDAGSGIHHS